MAKRIGETPRAGRALRPSFCLAVVGVLDGRCSKTSSSFENVNEAGHYAANCGRESMSTN